jgi:hypothetical protein
VADQPTTRQQEPDDGSAETAVRTGIRDQWLVVSGWGASHADTGTPGPHVRLGTNDGRDPVLKTSQISDLVDALHTVGGRIDQMWEMDGSTWFTGDEPDDNDPAVQRQHRIESLELHTLIADHWAEVATLLEDADNTDQAMERIGSLLGVDETRILILFHRFSLFTLTRGARQARARTLAELRES